MKYFVITHNDGVLGGCAKKVVEDNHFITIDGVSEMPLISCNLRTGQVQRDRARNTGMFMFDKHPDHTIGAVSYVDDEAEMNRQLVFDIFEW